MGVNSIRADKLSAIVHRILNKEKLSFLDGFHVSAVAVYFHLMGILWHSFQSDIFKGKKYQNCSNVLLGLRGTKLKCNLIKLDFPCVREVLFLSIFGEVVLCKKGKLTTRIKCEKVSSLEYFWAKIPLGGWKGCVIGEWGSYAYARVTPITVWVLSKNESKKKIRWYVH